MALVHENGAWNSQAEAQEVDRRMAGRPEWQRAYLARQVREEASFERWPIWERQLSCEWTQSEKATLEFWMYARGLQPISRDGNEVYFDAGVKIDQLTNAIEARCEARLALEVEMGLVA